MTSMKPYLIRAMYEWMADNYLTPHLVVDAEEEGVEVPDAYIRDGKIVLNIAMDAVRSLELGNEWISFSARFSGRSMMIHIPIKAVQVIYAKENGQGLPFPPEMDDEVEPVDSSPAARTERQFSVVDNETQAEPEEEPVEANDNRPRGKPSLKVVK
ncbi:ClpXP protease specificity-enhancing factor [Candidatus Albibeggiatoa sp. nov. BB20]|uniref:ClpXP protease specificity-enhancing factor n=1 Tax=Candidatus Albibeggiatoa sp. nov. BB20 TaxID=3162723 RepID=UPI0033653E08